MARGEETGGESERKGSGDDGERRRQAQRELLGKRERELELIKRRRAEKMARENEMAVAVASKEARIQRTFRRQRKMAKALLRTAVLSGGESGEVGSGWDESPSRSAAVLWGGSTGAVASGDGRLEEANGEVMGSKLLEEEGDKEVARVIEEVLGELVLSATEDEANMVSGPVKNYIQTGILSSRCASGLLQEGHAVRANGEGLRQSASSNGSVCESEMVGRGDGELRIEERDLVREEEERVGGGLEENGLSELVATSVESKSSRDGARRLQSWRRSQIRVGGAEAGIGLASVLALSRSGSFEDSELVGNGDLGSFEMEGRLNGPAQLDEALGRVGDGSGESRKRGEGDGGSGERREGKVGGGSGEGEGPMCSSWTSVTGSMEKNGGRHGSESGLSWDGGVEGRKPNAASLALQERKERARELEREAKLREEAEERERNRRFAAHANLTRAIAQRLKEEKKARDDVKAEEQRRVEEARERSEQEARERNARFRETQKAKLLEYHERLRAADQHRREVEQRRLQLEEERKKASLRSFKARKAQHKQQGQQQRYVKRLSDFSPPVSEGGLHSESVSGGNENSERGGDSRGTVGQPLSPFNHQQSHSGKTTSALEEANMEDRKWHNQQQALSESPSENQEDTGRVADRMSSDSSNLGPMPSSRGQVSSRKGSSRSDDEFHQVYQGPPPRAEPLLMHQRKHSKAAQQREVQDQRGGRNKHQ